jgi:hypothetical protein
MVKKHKSAKALIQNVNLVVAQSAIIKYVADMTETKSKCKVKDHRDKTYLPNNQN